MNTPSHCSTIQTKEKNLRFWIRNNVSFFFFLFGQNNISSAGTHSPVITHNSCKIKHNLNLCADGKIASWNAVLFVWLHNTHCLYNLGRITECVVLPYNHIAPKHTFNDPQSTSYILIHNTRIHIFIRCSLQLKFAFVFILSLLLCLLLHFNRPNMEIVCALFCHFVSFFFGFFFFVCVALLFLS